MRASLVLGVLLYCSLLAPSALAAPAGALEEAGNESMQVHHFAQLPVQIQEVLIAHKAKWPSYSEARKQKLKGIALYHLGLSQNRWQHLSEQQRKELKKRRQKFSELNPQQRQKLMRAWRKFKELPPEQQKRLRARFKQQWQDLEEMDKQ